MNNQWIIWLIIAIIVLLIIGFIAFVAYRKKKQYEFLSKMMQKQKEEQARVEREQAFVEKREKMSSTEATNIIHALGGKHNIIEIEQNAIRIRVQVTDTKQIDQQALKAAGVSGIIKTTQGLQLIMGDRADQVAKEMKQIVERS